MTTALAPLTVHPLLLVLDDNKDTRTRIEQFVAWQTDRPGQLPYLPDLAAYRDALKAEGLANSTVAAYLATVRGAYGRLLRSNAFRQMVMDATPYESPADRKAAVDELFVRLANAIDPAASRISVTVKQDEVDETHLRLTPQQAEQLLYQPNADALTGLRDAAMIALLLATGIRKFELCDLDVDDLRQEADGQLCLLVRHGKGDKQRAVPYGEQDAALFIVEEWLRRAGIEAGPVFRNVDRWGNVSDEPLVPRSVDRVLARYPVIHRGKGRRVRPHDLRRTYAKLQYEAGMDLLAIQQNLGHKDHKTTLRYIGTFDMDRRAGRVTFRIDVSRFVAEG